jgi:hypothetical protein
MAIAKQAVAAACSIKPDEVRIDEDGEIAFGQNGSAVIFLGVKTDPPRFTLNSLVLENVKINSRVYEIVNSINSDINFGAFYVYKEDVWFDYSFPVDNPTPDLVRFVMDACIGIVDHYDDRLKGLIGGERYIENADDEVEI